jgi:hypothetical protein
MRERLGFERGRVPISSVFSHKLFGVILATEYTIYDEINLVSYAEINVAR